MKKRYVVIMAGGRGERFWPQSRLRKPKHLLPIVGDSPMLAQTVDRLSGLVPPEQVFVITNAEQRDAVLESCPGLLPERVIGEPQGRDTAAAVGLAALLVENSDPGAAFALLPADHVIADGDGFRKVLAGAFEAAESEDFLVTIGISPDFPSTGYGYLKQGGNLETASDRPVHQVERFVEKPNLEKAEQYLKDGGYFWNAGMFVWRPKLQVTVRFIRSSDLWKNLTWRRRSNTLRMAGIFGTRACLFGDLRSFSQPSPSMHRNLVPGWKIYLLAGGIPDRSDKQWIRSIQRLRKSPLILQSWKKPKE